MLQDHIRPKLERERVSEQEKSLDRRRREKEEKEEKRKEGEEEDQGAILQFWLLQTDFCVLLAFLR